jgi:hypothetical protein
MYIYTYIYISDKYIPKESEIIPSLCGSEDFIRFPYDSEESLHNGWLFGETTTYFWLLGGCR